MSGRFDIFGPGQTRTGGGGNGGGMPRQTAANATRVTELRELLEDRERELGKLRDEPMMTATVVEVRGDRMSIALGPGAPVDIHAIAGAAVGDRVRCHRNTMQAFDVIAAHPGDAHPGAIVIAQRQTGTLVEAEMLGTMRAFRTAPGVTVKKGERVIVDPSMTFVIGSLGMPPQSYAHAASSSTISMSWDDIGGHDEAKAALREAIELPYSHPGLFKAYGKRPVRGVLLAGPPGCGKTILAKAAATAIARAHGHAHADGFVYVKGPELLNAYIGRSEEAIRRLFQAARSHHATHGYPAVIFLDECDALLGARDHGINTTINATTVPQFLAEMDGLDDQATMMILATNRPDMLDPAVVREGRIDRRVTVKRPDIKDAYAIFAIHLRGRPTDRDLDLDLGQHGCAELYSASRVVGRDRDGRDVLLGDAASGAMIAGIVEQASTQAMMRDIGAGSATASGIKVDDLRWAVDRAQAALATTSTTSTTSTGA